MSKTNENETFSGCRKSEGFSRTEENLKTDSPEKKALDDLGITKYCCRRMLITHTDVVEIMN